MGRAAVQSDMHGHYAFWQNGDTRKIRHDIGFSRYRNKCDESWACGNGDSVVLQDNKSTWSIDLFLSRHIFLSPILLLCTSKAALYYVRPPLDQIRRLLIGADIHQGEDGMVPTLSFCPLVSPVSPPTSCGEPCGHVTTGFLIWEDEEHGVGVIESMERGCVKYGRVCPHCICVTPGLREFRRATRCRIRLWRVVINLVECFTQAPPGISQNNNEHQDTRHHHTPST